MSNDPEAGRKLRQAIEKYALDQTAGRKMSPLEAVLECFIPDDDSQNEIRSFLIDLVFRYVLAAGRMHFASDAPGTEDERLDRFLKRYTRLTDETLANFRKRLKQAILTAEAERPKTERRNRILEKQRRQLCYLCGEPINEEDEQLDHVWPHNAGGGTSGENLRKAHAACQIFKHDLAVPGDAAMGRFAYHAGLPRQLRDPARAIWEEPQKDASTFTELLDDVRASGLRMALLLRQEGKCYFCSGEFRTIGPVRLLKLEIDLPWWPPNTALACSQCAKENAHADICQLRSESVTESRGGPGRGARRGSRH